MTKRKVWRYKCDFCRKTNCSGGSISAHEKACFRNPNRVCGICDIQWPIPDLIPHIAALEDVDKKNEQQLTENIAEVIDYCPACICAAISQAKLPTIEDYSYTDDEGAIPCGTHKYHMNFDYKKKRDEWNQEKIRTEIERDSDINAHYCPW